MSGWPGVKNNASVGVRPLAGGRGPELSKATGCPHSVICEHGGPAAAQGPAGVLALFPITHPF